MPRLSDDSCMIVCMYIPSFHRIFPLVKACPLFGHRTVIYNASACIISQSTSSGRHAIHDVSTRAASPSICIRNRSCPSFVARSQSSSAPSSDKSFSRADSQISYAATSTAAGNVPLQSASRKPDTPKSFRFSRDSRRQSSSSFAGRYAVFSESKSKLLRRFTYAPMTQILASVF